MFKKISMLLIVAVFITGISGLLYAMSCHGNSGYSQDQQFAQAQSEQAPGTAGANVDNKICPVTGDKINETTKSTVKYDGKIYNLCCSACIDVFKSDPQKYIKKVEEEKKTTSK